MGQNNKFGLHFNTSQLLVAALIVVSFVLGSLYTKVQYLEKGNSLTGAPKAQVAAPQAQGGAPNQPQARPTLGKQNVDAGHIPVKGDQNAKVTIIEFADFRCPFCERFFTDTEPQIIKDYVDSGKAKFAFRQYAFLGPASTVAANASECANDQGKFWEFHDYLYENQPSESDTSLYTVDKLSQIAGQLSMDSNAFSTCLTANKFSKNVTDDFAAGQKAGVQGTPTTFINGTPIVGAVPYAQIKAEIDKALQ